MAVQRFTTTRLSTLRAAGQVRQLQHAVVASALDRELGPAYGRLFADFEAEDSDVRAWYIEADRPPQLLSSLPADTQGAVRLQLAGMLAEIGLLTERMSRETTQKANLARVLIAATTFPEEDIWWDGKQPILVNWGFHRHAVPDGTPTAITSLGKTEDRVGQAGSPAPEPKPEPLSSVPLSARLPPHRRWLAAGLWLVFVALLVTLYGLLLPACGIGPLSPGGVCRPKAGNPAQEGAMLQRMVEAAELDLARQHQLCGMPHASAAPPPISPEPDRRQAAVTQDIEKRLPPDAPRGSVEISLLWNNVADLDLIVECPDGSRLSQADREACGGHLLQDINKAGDPSVSNPIEHAAWDNPKPGLYTVKVQLYGYNAVPDGTDIPFTVRIKRGDQIRLVEGHVKGAQTIVTAATTDL